MALESRLPEKSAHQTFSIQRILAGIYPSRHPGVAKLQGLCHFTISCSSPVYLFPRYLSFYKISKLGSTFNESSHLLISSYG